MVRLIKQGDTSLEKKKEYDRNRWRLAEREKWKIRQHAVHGDCILRPTEEKRNGTTCMRYRIVLPTDKVFDAIDDIGSAQYSLLNYLPVDTVHKAVKARYHNVPEDFVRKYADMYWLHLRSTSPWISFVRAVAWLGEGEDEQCVSVFEIGRNKDRCLVIEDRSKGDLPLMVVEAKDVVRCNTYIPATVVTSGKLTYSAVEVARRPKVGGSGQEALVYSDIFGDNRGNHQWYDSNKVLLGNEMAASKTRSGSKFGSQQTSPVKREITNVRELSVGRNKYLQPSQNVVRNLLKEHPCTASHREVQTGLPLWLFMGTCPPGEVTVSDHAKTIFGTMKYSLAAGDGAVTGWLGMKDRKRKRGPSRKNGAKKPNTKQLVPDELQFWANL